jgi:hypothetical protein
VINQAENQLTRASPAPAPLTRQPVGIAGAGDGEAGDRHGRAAQPVGVHGLDAVRHRRPRPRRRGGRDGDGMGLGIVTVGGAAFKGGAAREHGGSGWIGGVASGPGREEGDPVAGRGRHCRRRAARARVLRLLAGFAVAHAHTRRDRRQRSRGVAIFPSFQFSPAR